MRCLTVIATLVVAIAGPSSAPANAATTLLQPTEPWNINYGEGQCVASRNYGSGEKPLYLMLKPSATDAATQLLIVQTGTGDRATQYDVFLSTDSGAPIGTTALDYTLEQPRRRVRSLALSADQMKSLAGATRLDIAASRAASFHFAVRQMGLVQTKLDDCMKDLFSRWKLSPEDRGRVTHIASADLRGVFSDADYPLQAISERNTGSVEVRLLIETTGKIADCAVLETSGSAVLDARTCSILATRGKFSPAIDKDGRPLPSFFRQRVNWRMP